MGTTASKPPTAPAPQVHASACYLKLITFDADGTLYADGAHIEHDNQMIRHIISLMRRWARLLLWRCIAVRAGGALHAGGAGWPLMSTFLLTFLFHAATCTWP